MAEFTLIHAPSVITNTLRFKNSLITDFIPSTSSYEIYPIGFLTISEYLERKGINTRIINLTNLCMLGNTCYQKLEKFISSIKLKFVGIDFHWLVHANGALELAKLIKRIHPYAVIILGGFSATYFYKEILTKYPYIDYIVLGDSTEEPLFRLLTAIKENNSPENIPNIAYRKNGKIVKNEIICPDDLNHLNYDYRFILSKIKKEGFNFYNPYYYFKSFPILYLPTVRGCLYNCLFCGGSKYAYKRVLNRIKPIFYNPDKLAEDIKKITTFCKFPIFLGGDITQAGEIYMYKFFKKLKDMRIKNTLIFELFTPWDYNNLKLLNKSVDNFILQISPETDSERIRYKFGRLYSNASLENLLIAALDLTNTKRIELFFTLGLPEQDYNSIQETLRYIAYLYRNFKDKIRVYISPLAPFIDPGSILYENPEDFGYKIFYRKLSEYKDILLYPTWKYHLSYQTDKLTRDELVKLSYQALIKLKEIKLQHNIITKKLYKKFIQQLKEELNFIEKWDDILKDKIFIKDLFKTYNKRSIIKEEFLSFSKKSFFYTSLIKGLLFKR
jgi:B12-binding domain/radical SAM domain protein